MLLRDRSYKLLTTVARISKIILSDDREVKTSLLSVQNFTLIQFLEGMSDPSRPNISHDSVTVVTTTHSGSPIRLTLSAIVNSSGLSQLVPGRMVELYCHFHIRPHSTVLN